MALVTPEPLVGLTAGYWEARKRFQAVGGKANAGPVVFLESRTAIAASTGATSTQLASLELRELLRHAGTGAISTQLPSLLLLELLRHMGTEATSTQLA